MKSLPKSFWAGILLGAAILTLMAYVPALTDFNSNHFGTGGNKVYIKNGASVTNFIVVEDVLKVQSPAEFQITGGAAAGFILKGDANGVAAWTTNVSQLQVTNMTVINNITIKGKQASFVSVNGTNVAQPNLLDSASVTLGYDGGSNITMTASGGGGSVWMPNTALVYSGGTNVTIDGSGGTNFFLLVTNTAFFATPGNVPASKTTNTSFTVFFQMDGTGTWDVTWTNGSFKWPGGSIGQFKPATNANAVSWVSFTMSPFTNGIFCGDYGVLASQ